MNSTNFDPHTVEILNNRLRIVSLIIAAVVLALVFRLWYLQLIRGGEYRIKSENNRIHLRDIPPFRGMVFDRENRLLVDNQPSYDMYVLPEDVQDREVLLRSLESLIGLPRQELMARLGDAFRRQPFKPILIKQDLTRSELALVETNRYNLPGVMIQVTPRRHYILGAFAPHVVGYLGEINESQLAGRGYPENKRGDLIGKYGVEKRWQREMNGQRGGEQVEVDAAGRILRVISRKPPVAGSNVVLTIDRDLQVLAEKAMGDKRGAVVALVPGTGEVLAMVSGPSFDPNLFVGGVNRKDWMRISSNKDSPLQNRTIAGQYPPGSLFKIVVALAGLEEGIIDPGKGVLCQGRFKLGRRTYRCWKRSGHGALNLHQALVQSCDVYFYKLGLELGVDKIAEYAHQLGLGHSSGFDLGGDKKGIIPTRHWKLERSGVPWQLGETVSASIGQSYVLATPLQMALMISAVFNGGIVYQPKITRWVGKGPDTVYTFRPTVKDRLKVKPENLERIKEALAGVVNEPRGTGSKARIQGTVVAGKTGTAQVIALDREKMISKNGELPVEYRDHAWFVAIAPKEDPQVAVAVLIEHGGHGGSAAAPVASELIEAYLKKKGILPPSDIVTAERP